jgi:Type IX secretion system membrane protein PorP/SprF
MKNSMLLIVFRIVIVLCGLFVAGSKAFAQQDPLYGLYLNNPLVINPAYTGIDNNLAAFTSCRNQWPGFDVAMKTLSHQSTSPKKHHLYMGSNDVVRQPTCFYIIF